MILSSFLKRSEFKLVGCRLIYAYSVYYYVKYAYIFHYRISKSGCKHLLPQTWQSRLVPKFYPPSRVLKVMLMLFSYSILVCSMAFAQAASQISEQAYSEGALVDQVTELPGATSDLKSNQFSGYLNITDTKALHYMYFESERNPAKDSVVFWTNGGPGCSGLLGLYTEFGPWRVSRNRTLLRNPFAWTKFASIVFLEQPVGVGFSYSTIPIPSTGYNDFEASKDNLRAIKAFFAKYPERVGNPFFLASESYGGHYIPQWTLQVLNDREVRGKFKGFFLGNPYTSYGSGSVAMANALWGLQLVPKPLWDAFTERGCESLYNSAYDLSDECFEIMDALFSYVDHLNPYALEFPTCDLDNEGTNSSAVSTGAVSGSSSGTSRESRGGATVKRRTMRHSKFVSPQAVTLLHMHDRVRTSPTYQKYQQARKLHSSDAEVDARLSGTVEGAEKREIIDYSQYVLPVDWDVSEEWASKRRKSGQSTPSPDRETRKRGSQTILSEESEFAYDPCAQTYLTEYLTSLPVQKALHVYPDPRLPFSSSASATTSTTTTASVETARPWGWCSEEVNSNWAFNDYLSDTTDLYRAIYTHKHKPRNFKMLVYSGDVDGVCATIGTQHWIYNVTHSAPTSLFKTWDYDDVKYGTQLGGYVTKFADSFSFMTVRYAGHEVPAYQPQKALLMFQQYLEGTLFDTSAQHAHAVSGGSSSSGTNNVGGEEESQDNQSGGEASADGNIVPTVMAVLLSAVLLLGVAVCFRKQIASSLL